MNYYDDFADVYDLMPVGDDGDVHFYTEEAKGSKGKILEIACGTGRITIPLKKAGIDVMGLDLSSNMLRKLQIKTKKEKIKLDLFCADMRHFAFKTSFSLIIVPYNSFLCLDSVKDQMLVLKNIYDHLEKGGKLILNFFNPVYKNLCNFDGKIKFINDCIFVHPKSKNKTLLWVSKKYDNLQKKLNQNFIFKEFNTVNEICSTTILPVNLCCISQFEFIKLLDMVGFKEYALFGGFNYEQFSPDSKQMVWIIKK